MLAEKCLNSNDGEAIIALSYDRKVYNTSRASRFNRLLRFFIWLGLLRFWLFGLEQCSPSLSTNNAISFKAVVGLELLNCIVCTSTKITVCTSSAARIALSNKQLLGFLYVRPFRAELNNRIIHRISHFFISSIAGNNSPIRSTKARNILGAGIILLEIYAVTVCIHSIAARSIAFDRGNNVSVHGYHNPRMTFIAVVTEEHLVANLGLPIECAVRSVKASRVRTTSASRLGRLIEHLKRLFIAKTLDKAPINENITPAESILLAVVELRVFVVNVPCIFVPVIASCVCGFVVELSIASFFQISDLAHGAIYELGDCFIFIHFDFLLWNFYWRTIEHISHCDIHIDFMRKAGNNSIVGILPNIAINCWLLIAVFSTPNHSSSISECVNFEFVDKPRLVSIYAPFVPSLFNNLTERKNNWRDVYVPSVVNITSL